MNKNMPTTTNIFIAMISGLIIGAVINKYTASEGVIQVVLVKGLIHILGQSYIRILQMLALPLVAVSLISAVCKINDINILGRIGIKSFVFYIVTTLLAVVPALLLVCVFSPGKGGVPGIINAPDYAPPHPLPLTDTLINIVPNNPFAAFAEGDILAIMFFVILFAIALLHTGEDSKSLVVSVEKINAVLVTMITLIMKFTLIGIFCLMAETASLQGFTIFLPIAGYFTVALGALLFHFFLTLSLLLLFLTKLNPITMINKMRPAHIIAFTTASSIATIPITQSTVQNKLGVSKKVAAFTIPLGASINMDGAATMQVIATLFIANVYNIDLEFIHYIMIIALTIIASIGTVGAPGQGLVMLAMILDQIGLPIEGIGLIIGADRILDMLRTVVNVHGDAVVACIVAHSENEIDRDIFNRDI